ncbi:XRE family transcriptional regulator [Proteiniphilum sp.]|uniref:XRE family transcriptional regulator n=1 Tax=Proteiniphilum sp. TaxID=1926877 RepID=UPI003319DF7B
MNHTEKDTPPRERWTLQEKEFVLSQLGKKNFDDIGREIGRSGMAIKLFVHRQRLPVRRTVKNNILIRLLELKFGKPEYFTPTREFYREVGMTQMRFWALYKGEAQITEKEYIDIRDHFKIDAEVAFESRQLNLFTPPHKKIAK